MSEASRFVVLPTSWRGAGRRFFDPGGRPGPGLAGDDQPGPPVRRLRVAEFRRGPAQDLLEHSEGMFKIETAQERLPQAVHVSGRGAGERAPQPYRLGVPVAGQVIDLEADQGALDDWQRAVMADPGGPVGQPGVQPVPGDRKSVV